jgi:predicted glycosyltransferase
MARGRAVSLLFYAINGRGLGHLTRLLAIARAARELLDALEVAHDFQFVTTSEAAAIADDFPVYKLPSKTALGRVRNARERHVQNAKLIVSNLVAAQNPDLLVIDTVPYGAFQEVAFLRSYARATAYVYRRLNERAAASELVQRHLELFDRIVVPDTPDAADHYPLPRAARDRVSFVGAIHGFDAARAWPRERVRDYFGVGTSQRLVYVSAGGGGDGRAELDRLVRAVAANSENFVLAGYGPLHRGECVYAPNVVPLLEPNVSRFFGGLDAAISAAGYNSYQELLAARVPSLFFAQKKGLDRQDARLERELSAGLYAVIEREPDADLLRARLEDLLSGAAGRAMRRALATREVPNGALQAAAALLAVCASLGDVGFERASLFEVAAWRRDLPAPLADDFVTHGRAYRSWRALAASLPEIAAERDRNIERWWSGRSERCEEIARGAELGELRAKSGADDETWRAILQAFALHSSARAQSLKLSELSDALRALHASELGPALVELAQNETKSALRDAILARARDRDAENRGDADENEGTWCTGSGLRDRELSGAGGRARG